MHKRMVFFVLFFAFINPIIHLSTYAGGPEEGWLGVSSLNFSYKGKPLEFVRPHTHLAQLEKEVSDILPTNTPTNIVFVAISFIYDGRFKEEYIVGGPSNLPYSFESGWTSMMHNPVLEETQTAIRPFAPLLQRQEGLEITEKQKLLGVCQTLAEKDHLFQRIIKKVYFHESHPPIKDILTQSEATFAGIRAGDPGYVILQELIINKGAYERESAKLEQTNSDAHAALEQSTRKLKQETILENLKEIEEIARSHKGFISKQSKTVDNIGSKVIATYWHSEQRFLHYIRMHTTPLLEGILKDKERPDAVVLNLHSRFDICPVCSHSLVRSCSASTGALFAFKKAICAKFGMEDVPFFLLASFREKREKSPYTIGSSNPHSLEELAKLPLTFPLMQIPLK